MVIFGALLGVLDPVLTLAAAETAQGDVLRMPNEAMVAEYEARKAAKDGGSRDYEESSSRGQGHSPWFQKARNMQQEKREELAGGNSSDHAAVLAAFRVSHAHCETAWCLRSV
jgi:hypothetical protein